MWKTIIAVCVSSFFFSMQAIAEQLPERFIGSWQVQELEVWGNMVDKRQEPCSKSDADMVIISDKAIDIDNNRPCKITSVKMVLKALGVRYEVRSQTLKLVEGVNP